MLKMLYKPSYFFNTFSAEIKNMYVHVYICACLFYVYMNTYFLCPFFKVCTIIFHVSMFNSMFKFASELKSMKVYDSYKHDYNLNI